MSWRYPLLGSDRRQYLLTSAWGQLLTPRLTTTRSAKCHERPNGALARVCFSPALRLEEQPPDESAPPIPAGEPRFQSARQGSRMGISQGSRARQSYRQRLAIDHVRLSRPEARTWVTCPGIRHDPRIDHHLSALRHREGGTYAGRCLPSFLRVQQLRRNTAT